LLKIVRRQTRRTQKTSSSHTSIIRTRATKKQGTRINKKAGNNKLEHHKTTTKNMASDTDSSDNETNQDRRVRQRSDTNGYWKPTKNPYRQILNPLLDQKHDKKSDRESDSTTSNNRNTGKIKSDHSEQDQPEQNQQASAWREIFRKYRIQSIPQPTNLTREEPRLQPTNFPQNGNTAIGDDIDPIDDNKTFRIYYQNVNGISASKGTSKWNEINETMTRHKVALFGLTETNIEWNKYKNQLIMKTVLRKHFKQATMQTSTTTMNFADDYKPGGICTVTTNKWTGRTLTTIADDT
jgi:hypothetical protein